MFLTFLIAAAVVACVAIFMLARRARKARIRLAESNITKVKASAAASQSEITRQVQAMEAARGWTPRVPPASRPATRPPAPPAPRRVASHDDESPYVPFTFDYTPPADPSPSYDSTPSMPDTSSDSGSFSSGGGDSAGAGAGGDW